jgi:hypothetical protein
MQYCYCHRKGAAFCSRCSGPYDSEDEAQQALEEALLSTGGKCPFCNTISTADDYNIEEYGGG